MAGRGHRRASRFFTLKDSAPVVEEAERGAVGKISQTGNGAGRCRSRWKFEGRIDTISPTASLDFGAGWPVSQFSVDMAFSNQ